MKNNYKGLLADVLNIKYYENEPLSEHCSFKIGGPCPIFIEIDSVSTLQTIVRKFNEAGIDFLFLGNGSNMLFPDEGIDKPVIHFASEFNKLTVNGDRIFAQAGISLAALANAAQRAGLSGLEFASGIPGSLGGAVLMNAGAYGGEMSQVLESAELMDKHGNINTFKCEEMNFGYRHSLAMTDSLIVLSATFKLKFADKAEILAAQQELNKRRREKQPLSFPSAGSFFKRPEGNFASALIEQSGLKGFRIGGAEVSTLHAGFIINVDNASYSDVIALMEHIQKTILSKHGILLQPEVRIIQGNNK